MIFHFTKFTPLPLKNVKNRVRMLINLLYLNSELYSVYKESQFQALQFNTHPILQGVNHLFDLSKLYCNHTNTHYVPLNDIHEGILLNIIESFSSPKTYA